MHEYTCVTLFFLNFLLYVLELHIDILKKGYDYNTKIKKHHSDSTSSGRLGLKEITKQNVAILIISMWTEAATHYISFKFTILMQDWPS